MAAAGTSPRAGAAGAAGRSSRHSAVVVWEALQDHLLGHSGFSGPCSVVDVGGGTGGYAVRVAELGHQVTVVDPSPDALAILARRAEESGVSDRVTALQGELAGLADLVPAGGADLVLYHGVLEFVAPEATSAALRSAATALRPGGVLSLLVNQRHAAVLARAMAGHFVAARALLESAGSSDGSAGQVAGPVAGHVAGQVAGPATGHRGDRRFTAEEVVSAMRAAGFDTPTLHAVRVFADLVPSSLVDLEPGAAAALVELERAVANRPEYLTLATQIHAVGTRR